MNINQWKDGVWYERPGKLGQWRVRKEPGVYSFEYRQDAWVPSVFQAMGAEQARADDWTEVVTDPCEVAWGRFVGKDRDNVQPNCRMCFNEGWAARESHGLKIDVEAAYDAFLNVPKMCVQNLLAEINSGKFLVKP